MMKLIDFICAIIVRVLNIVFHYIPIGFTLWLGRRLGVIAYFVNTDRRIIGYSNLRAAFCEKKTPRELRCLLKAVYMNLSQTFFEILSLTKLSKKYIDKYIEVVNFEERQWLNNYPKGIILLTAHFGNWELSAAVSAIKGFPLVVLAREQSMKRMNELLNRIRESNGLQIVRKGITTKLIVKALHQGKIIGMVGDQNAGKTGVFINFMGRPASTAPGSARIAAKTGAYILPAFIVRQKGPYHRVTLEEPMKIEKTEDITPYLVRYNKLLENYVREHPEQWLWLHKRWKATPLRKVTVLNDGKAGHLNQSLALCKLLKKYREDSGYAPQDTEVEVVDIKFKSRLRKSLLDIFSLFSGNWCQGCMKCLKFCLREESYNTLFRRYSDINVSCGSGVTAVNRFFSIENNSKSACIMKPSVLGLGKFDMVVLPQHDGVSAKEGKRIVTDVVPNLIDEKYMKDSAASILAAAGVEKGRRIGVLLGGNNSSFTLTVRAAEELLDKVLRAAENLDAEILFTTSRRTPPDVERFIKDRLRQEKRCRLLVIANENNTPHTVAGIMGLSGVIIVSCDSVSMISEAV
ncbi:MAG: mitochondrial fission ELM1 family protein, partial [Candidatus Omnitrophica bacterium]|nr:mitochondrial fission ELM1 family protein [Candidatus Omnitrophota bacterium]